MTPPETRTPPEVSEPATAPAAPPPEAGTPTPKTDPRRAIGLVLLLAAAAAALVWAVVVFVEYGRLSVTLHQPREVEDPRAAPVTDRVIEVAGTAERAAAIELVVNNIPDRHLENEYEPVAFTLRDVRLRPGWNTVEVRAVLPGYALGLHKKATRQVYFQPDPPSRPALVAPPFSLNTNVLPLRGAADPGAQVVATIRRLPKQSGDGPGAERFRDFTHTVRAGDDGRFLANVVFPLPGHYSVSVHALNRRGTQSEATAPAKVAFEPVRPAAAEPPTARRVDAAISYRRYRVTLEAVLRSDDPRVVALSSGDIKFAHFVREVFFQDWPHVWANDVTPEIIPKGEVTTVRATANPQYPLLPLVAGKVTLPVLDRHLSKDTADTYSVAVKDYEARYARPPAKVAGGVATWESGREGDELSGGVEVALSYDPTQGPRNFLRFVRSLLLEALPPPAHNLTVLLFACLISAPMLWVLWHLRSFEPSPEPFDDEAERLARAARWLLAFAFTPLALSLPYDLSALLGSPLRRLAGQSDAPFLYDGLLFLPATWLLAFALDRALKPFDTGGAAAFVARSVVRATGWAALIALVVTASALFYDLGPDDVAVRRTTATLIALPFLAALFLVVRWLLGPAAPGGGWWRRRRALALFAVLTCILWITFAHPPFTNSASVLSTAYWNYLNVAFFIDVVQQLAPYLFLLGLVLTLRRWPEGGGFGGLTLDRVALIIFALYLVGATAGWLRVPVGFLLALWVFPRWVFAPESRRAELAQIRPQIVAERGHLLQETILLSDVEQFRGALDRLKKKVIRGEVEPTEYTKQREQIEAFIEEQASRSELSKDLKLRDVVLGVGPFPSDWENGVWAAKKGAVLAALAALIFSLGFLKADVWLQNPYTPLLFFVSGTIVVISDWLAVSFFFGYFFAGLRGKTGLRKGLNLWAAHTFCLLPVLLLTASPTFEPREIAVGILLTAGLSFLLLTLLGLWAFDYHTFRGALGERFGWKSFLRLGEMSSLTAFTSVGLASLAGIVGSVLTGQAKTLLEFLLQTAAASMSTPPR